ncbi:MAG: hypothetical protein ACR2HP_16945 [Ilumatobacteraceae bacterium]
MRRLFLAQVFSLMGTAGALLATAYLAYQHSNSVVHTAIVATAFGVPATFLGPAAGRLAAAGTIAAWSSRRSPRRWRCGPGSRCSTSLVWSTRGG